MNLLKIIFYSVCFAISSHTSVLAVPPLATGMAENLPASFITLRRFVAFDQAPNIARAPLAVEIFFNDQPVKIADRETQSIVFDEFFMATLPSHSPIKVGKNPQDWPTWDYPVGTQVIHLITFKTNPVQIFEMRMEQKLPDGHWAFGIYTPSPTGFSLNHYAGFRSEAFNLSLASGQMMNVRLAHLNLDSCRNCHYGTSPSRYQFPSSEYMGPCGFGPANLGLYQKWGASYQNARGEPGFVSQLSPFLRRR
jgi:hypothetical protein